MPSRLLDGLHKAEDLLIASLVSALLVVARGPSGSYSGLPALTHR